MLKAMFFDLDGTLLDDEKRLSEPVYQALLACRERGIHLFVATARPPCLAEMHGWTEKQLSLFDGGIYLNGGCEKLADSVRFFCLPVRAVRQAMKIARDFPQVNFALQGETGTHAFRFPLEQKFYATWGVADADILPITAFSLQKTVKLLLFYDNLTDSQKKLPDALYPRLCEALREDARVLCTDAGKVIQITGCDAEKCKSIERIRTKLRLQADEIAVFGDDYNDLEMLKSFPNSVAMGNAPLPVQRAAKFVTKPNTENGVAYALQTFFRIK